MTLHTLTGMQRVLCVCISLSASEVASLRDAEVPVDTSYSEYSVPAAPSLMLTETVYHLERRQNELACSEHDVVLLLVGSLGQSC